MSKRVKIADLKFDPENARVRTAKGEAMIQESLRQVGAARSIVIDENGTILAGNGTVEAAGQIGIDNVVIVEASGDEIIAVRRKGLTDEQKKKLAYYDNRTGDEAEWDMEQVARDLLGGYDFLDELFDDIQVPEPEKEGTDELPEDPAEALREKWGVEYGDLWQIGPHRILCGDCTSKEDVELLLNGSTPGMVFTDPPYGIDYQDVKGSHKKIANDNSSPAALIAESLSMFSSIPIFACCNYKSVRDVEDGLISAGAHPKCCIVWDKGSRTQNLDRFAKRHEFILYSGPYGGQRTVDDDVWQINREVRKDHPTSKPVDLCARAIGHISCDSVYEPFAGSGSTMVAAHNEGRTCYAMEIDPAYVAVCIERMAQLGYDPDRVQKLHD